MKSGFCFLLGLAAFVSLTSGCAFSKSTVKLDFKPQTTAEKVAVDKVIVVEKLKDLRGGDPYLLANKGVGMKTSGTYVTEKEIAIVVTDAIKDTLALLNYKIAAGQGDLVLSGELLKVDSTPIMGFWSGQLDCTVQVNLKLSNARAGTPVWSEVLTGFNKKTGLQVDHEGHRRDAMEAALADLTNKLASSASFRRAVESVR
jgi:hypothetical protein